MNPAGKYKQFRGVELDHRQWPSNSITRAPIWCSVDLRDGNQALATPMTVDQKLEFFKVLVQCGFKEIEIGFPAASPTDFAFTRKLIEGKLIPDDVTIQVLVQAREDLIKGTVLALEGARNVIIHMYNSTSPAQRRIVFGLEKPDIVRLAVDGTCLVKKYARKLVGTNVRFEYSPESFSATEVDFALEVCEAVMCAWQPTLEHKIILNLPDTVQVATPNVYADQIEWFCRNTTWRRCAIISLHSHNDRGTGVAGTELGLLAGADRVEGTLFGNGERTGNLDIVTVALNLYTQGIDPELDLSDIPGLVQAYEQRTGMQVPSRHPYAGGLVFTAFSGSHQDAIRKGLQAQEAAKAQANGQVVPWDVPYLTINPKDIGRTYETVIRANGQSGKGGFAYLLDQVGIHLPKDLEREFGAVAKKAIDAAGREFSAADIRDLFWKEYILRDEPYKFVAFNGFQKQGEFCCNPMVWFGKEEPGLFGKGNGPVSAFVHALQTRMDIHLIDQSQQSLGNDENAYALAYVKLKLSSGKICWGAGIDVNIDLASAKAIISALNRGQS